MNPYSSQPDRAYWKRAIGTVHYSRMSDLWQPIALTRADRIATAGSCFAQHIGNNLARRGASYMDMEPAPIDFADESEARRWGFGVFSCRYGNVYTSRQLIQLFHEAHGNRIPMDPVWERNGRFFDALRPGIDPVGQATPEEVIALRKRHLTAVRKMFAELDLFVFTMGLTEGWEHREDGTMYPMAPGTVAGEYDPKKHVFRNAFVPMVQYLPTSLQGKMFYEPGAIGYEHRHVHEQVCYCLAGEFEFTIEGEKTRLKAGDSVYVPSSMLHGALCLSEGRLLDIFTPQREDFLKK